MSSSIVGVIMVSDAFNPEWGGGGRSKRLGGEPLSEVSRVIARRRAARKFYFCAARFFAAGRRRGREARSKCALYKVFL